MASSQLYLVNMVKFNTPYISYYAFLILKYYYYFFFQTNCYSCRNLLHRHLIYTLFHLFVINALVNLFTFSLLIIIFVLQTQSVFKQFFIVLLFVHLSNLRFCVLVVRLKQSNLRPFSTFLEYFLSVDY